MRAALTCLYDCMHLYCIAKCEERSRGRADVSPDRFGGSRRNLPKRKREERNKRSGKEELGIDSIGTVAAVARVRATVRRLLH
jgi:hypothetical protein